MEFRCVSEASLGPPLQFLPKDGLGIVQSVGSLAVTLSEHLELNNSWQVESASLRFEASVVARVLK